MRVYSTCTLPRSEKYENWKHPNRISVDASMIGWPAPIYNRMSLLLQSRVLIQPITFIHAQQSKRLINNTTNTIHIHNKQMVYISHTGTADTRPPIYNRHTREWRHYSDSIDVIEFRPISNQTAQMQKRRRRTNWRGMSAYLPIHGPIKIRQPTQASTLTLSIWSNR
jgi:hypothetical protein